MRVLTTASSSSDLSKSFSTVSASFCIWATSKAKLPFAGLQEEEEEEEEDRDEATSTDQHLDTLTKDEL